MGGIWSEVNGFIYKYIYIYFFFFWSSPRRLWENKPVSWAALVLDFVSGVVLVSLCVVSAWFVLRSKHVSWLVSFSTDFRMSTDLLQDIKIQLLTMRSEFKELPPRLRSETTCCTERTKRFAITVFVQVHQALFFCRFHTAVFIQLPQTFFHQSFPHNFVHSVTSVSLSSVT